MKVVLSVLGLDNLYQMALIEGREVYAVDTSPTARELAREIGVQKGENTLDLKEVEPSLLLTMVSVNHRRFLEAVAFKVQ